MKTNGNKQLLIRMPEAIGKPLRRDAKRQRVSMQTIMLGIVMAHYGLSIELPVRGSKKGTT